MEQNRGYVLIIATACLVGMHARASAQASGSAAPAAPAAAWSTANSTIGELLDNPATHAVLEKDIPVIVHSPQIDSARTMTLVDIQSYAPDDLSDAKLGQVDKDLAKIPRVAGK